jgi:hypothetical protein
MAKKLLDDEGLVTELMQLQKVATEMYGTLYVHTPKAKRSGVPHPDSLFLMVGFCVEETGTQLLCLRIDKAELTRVRKIDSFYREVSVKKAIKLFQR